MKKNIQKIYLLYPPVSKLERYSSKIGAAGGEQLPLGIYYLASYLLENGYLVKVTDAEANHLTVNEILNEIDQFSPNFVGISSTTVAFHRALECANEIKNKFESIKIILGGPHITSNYKHAMSYPAFDYGVIGEGEITLKELLDHICNHQPIEDIKGIVYRDQNDRVIKNPPREYISNLDILPFPAYELVKNMRLYTPPPQNYKSFPVATIITSRGCPNQCTFCDRNVFGKKYRERSAENVFKEIKLLYEKYQIKEIQFVDDTFLISKKRIYNLFELLDKAKIMLHWVCLSRINVVDYEFLKFLKSNGCWHISFGIESGDDRILKLIKKNIKLDQAKQVINWCKKLKIKSKGFFIIGHPGENLETIDKTIKISRELKLDDIVVTLNTPLPGSPQYFEANKYGKLDKTDWSKFNMWQPVFIPHGLSEEILLAKQKEMYRKFYLRPAIVLRYLISFFKKGGLKRFLSVFSASFYLIDKEKNNLV
ncbi:MAG: radical SAM protein [Candidatus Aminicenantes bacterium]|jgi:radical SAM superfamily enzyme YgiQ (UPF0313 family)